MSSAKMLGMLAQDASSPGPCERYACIWLVSRGQEMQQQRQERR